MRELAKLIGVKFPYTLKIYDFFPGDEKVKIRDFVVVETAQGVEIGQVVYTGKDQKVKDGEEAPKEIERLATKEDLERKESLEQKATGLFPLFKEKIEKFGLKMTPVGATYSLDEAKAIFYFTAEGRVDFRELARELSRTIQKQSILRQIGPRDEAKLVGGYGRCGREICCARFLLGTEGVTMETVEKQFGGPKNASKISGLCGRLMCCLNFEEEKGKSAKEKK